MTSIPHLLPRWQRRPLGPAGLFAALAAAAGPAAPTHAAPTLDEIVVTAQRREQSLQDTPIAVTAFTAEALANRRIEDISKVAGFTPNMVFDTTAPISGVSSGAVVFIRGIGQTDFSLTTDPGVGTYIDGVYASRAIGGVLDVLDIERIEVLRGPQGTLFGRNTIGGAINITTRKPGSELAGRLEISAGDEGLFDWKGSIDLPAGERLRSSLAVASHTRDGYVDRVLEGDTLGDEDRQSLRATVLFEATERLEFLLTVDAARVDEESAASVLVGITSDPGTSVYAYNEIFVPAFDPPEGPFDARFLGDDNDRSFATGPSGTQLDSDGAALTATFDLGHSVLKSITAWRRTEGEFFRDPDNSPIAITHTSNPDYRHEQFSQELQLTGDALEDRLHYVAGLYYFREEGDDNVFVPIYAAPAPGFALPVYIRNFAGVENDSKAAFLQTTYDILPRLSLTLGVRHTEDSKDFEYTQWVTADPDGNVPLFPLVGTGSGSADDEFSQTTYKAGTEFRLDDATLLYASYSEGYKSGGFNIRYVVPRPAPLPFDPEEVQAWEAGLKWQGWDDRLRANLAVFFTDYSEVQITLFETGGGPLTQNAGEAEISGLEIELTALPMERLAIELSGGYTDAEYTEINLPTTSITQPVGKDTRLPNTPEYSFSAALEYTVPLAALGQLALRADLQYRSSIENDAQNSPFLAEDGTTLANASLTWTDCGEQWDVAAFVENLADERFITSGDSNFGLGFHEANYNRPRQYGMTVRYRF